MPKPRKRAAPARVCLPSLEDLSDAYVVRSEECRKNHKHPSADDRCQIDPRVPEFQRRLAFFFEDLHPGKTVHELPEGEFQHELNRIAESLQIQAPQDTTYLLETFRIISPAEISPLLTWDKVTGAKRDFERRMKSGKPIRVMVEDGLTGKRRIEWRVWKTGEPTDSTRASKSLPTLDDVRRSHQEHPDWGAPMIAEQLARPRSQIRTVGNRLKQVRLTCDCARCRARRACAPSALSSPS
jgi:hypothetical protein